jgi:hypothetical protein
VNPATGRVFDAQTNHLAARHGFGFAAFDNAQVRHATTDDPMVLVVAKQGLSAAGRWRLPLPGRGI